MFEGEEAMIIINEHLSIPREELVFTASHSSGPGGQNVNKLNSRITLWFDIINSPSLSFAQKDLVLRGLQNRIGKDGVLRVTAQQTRSQAANRELATNRFAELLRDALKQIPKRMKTKVSRAAKIRRLEEKKQRGILKHGRSGKVSTED